MFNLPNKIADAHREYDSLYVLQSLRTPKGSKILARVLFGFIFIFILVLFLPWQQNIRGNGRVTALNPMNRPQTVESIIAGRIHHWYIREGDFIQKGDTILTITEIKEKYFDPKLLPRLDQQIKSKENSLNAKYQKAKALDRQITALRETMKLKVEQTKAKLEAGKVLLQNAENQFDRNRNLYDAGNITLTKYQEFEYKLQGSLADYQQTQIELSRIEAEYLDKISKVESELSSTYAEAFETEADIVKSRNDYSNTEIRNNAYQILAPQDGFIVKTLKSGYGETIKEGDPICTIMPDVSDLAVEMYIRAMDVPLISIGRKVRVQFDGWPALQFSGWPSVSVGTFGGEVNVIDYVNSNPGEFRILVTPDSRDEAWPQQLRMGSGTKGWVMLDDVPIWYELWRQLNGFPPTLYEAPGVESKIKIQTQGESK